MQFQDGIKNVTSAQDLVAVFQADAEQLKEEKLNERVEMVEQSLGALSPFSAQDIQSGSDSLVPEDCGPQEDYDLIFGEFLLGSTIKERAFYRIWRIRNEESWDKICRPDGSTYTSFGNMVQDIASNEALGIGRQIIYDRMKLYDQLHWAGYHDGEIIGKLSARPSLYLRAFNKVIEWDNDKLEPITLMLPTNENIDEEAEMQEQLQQFVEIIEEFPRQLDALDYIDENILHIPRVKTWMEGDSIVVEYTSTSVDENGAVIIDEYGRVKFYPDQSYPDWVSDELTKKIK